MAGTPSSETRRPCRAAAFLLWSKSVAVLGYRLGRRKTVSPVHSIGRSENRQPSGLDHRGILCNGLGRFADDMMRLGEDSRPAGRTMWRGRVGEDHHREASHMSKVEKTSEDDQTEEAYLEPSL